MEKYIQPFIDVCTKVFRDFVGAELTAERPYFTGPHTIAEWDISAVIGLTGEARGAVVISMKKNLAVRLTDMLTGTKHQSLDMEVVDAIGEIVNIIAGNVKKELEEDFRLVISLPTIVEGKNHKIQWLHAQTRIMCIPFIIFNMESFHLLVAIDAVK
jgi:chemotaxis protein CheX